LYLKHLTAIDKQLCELKTEFKGIVPNAREEELKQKPSNISMRHHAKN